MSLRCLFKDRTLRNTDIETSSRVSFWECQSAISNFKVAHKPIPESSIRTHSTFIFPMGVRNVWYVIKTQCDQCRETESPVRAPLPEFSLKCSQQKQRREGPLRRPRVAPQHCTHLGACWKCSIPGPSPHLQHQIPHLNTIPRWSDASGS